MNFTFTVFPPYSGVWSCHDVVDNEDKTNNTNMNNSYHSSELLSFYYNRSSTTLSILHILSNLIYY